MEKNVYTGVNLTNFPSEEYFHINSCGMQTNHKQHFTILRQEGRVDFHILYIVKGGLPRFMREKKLRFCREILFCIRRECRRDIPFPRQWKR